MLYSITLNQKVLLELEPSITITESIVLVAVYHLCTSVNEQIENKRITKNNIRYTWVDYKNLLEQVPLLNLKHPTSLWRVLKRLEDFEFLTSTIGQHKRKFVAMLPRVDEIFASYTKNPKTPGGVIEVQKRIQKTPKTPGGVSIYKEDENIKDKSINYSNLQKSDELYSSSNLCGSSSSQGLSLSSPIGSEEETPRLSNPSTSPPVGSDSSVPGEPAKAPADIDSLVARSFGTNDGEASAVVTSEVQVDPTNQVMTVFYEFNSGFSFGNKTQRSAALRLIESQGLDIVLNVAKAVLFKRLVEKDKFCPSIENPLELERKWLKVCGYLQLETKKTPKYIDFDSMCPSHGHVENPGF